MKWYIVITIYDVLVMVVVSWSTQSIILTWHDELIDCVLQAFLNCSNIECFISSLYEAFEILALKMIMLCNYSTLTCVEYFLILLCFFWTTSYFKYFSVEHVESISCCSISVFWLLISRDSHVLRQKNYEKLLFLY